MKLHKNLKGMELKRISSVYADDDNVMGEEINTIKKNVEAVSDTSKEVGLEENAEKTKCNFISRHQIAGQNHNLRTANKSFECGKLQIFGNKSNKSTFRSRRN
jgi:hypothetical protein